MRMILTLLLLTSTGLAQDLTFQTTAPAKITVDWNGKITIEKVENDPPPFGIQPEEAKGDGFKLTTENKPTRRILYFTADWCPPCKVWDDTIPRLKGLGEIQVYKMTEGVQDISDSNTREAIKHGVSRLPCFVLQDDNEPKWEVIRTKKVTERELQSWLLGNTFVANYQRRTP